MKIRAAGAELSHVDGQTDKHDETICAFRNFANALKIELLIDILGLMLLL
jgi:hypothetical protein